MTMPNPVIASLTFIALHRSRKGRWRPGPKDEAPAVSRSYFAIPDFFITLSNSAS